MKERRFLSIRYLNPGMHGCMFVHAPMGNLLLMQRICTEPGKSRFRDGASTLKGYGFYGTTCMDCKRVYHEVPKS